MLSIIVPVFNEAKIVASFINYIQKEMKGQDAELLIIDGGSTDNTVEICRNKGTHK